MSPSQNIYTVQHNKQLWVINNHVDYRQSQWDNDKLYRLTACLRGYQQSQVISNSIQVQEQSENKDPAGKNHNTTSLTYLVDRSNRHLTTVRSYHIILHP